MSHTPRVSVVMPVLDPHPVYFREAVRSVLGQSLGELELVIVEDPGERSAEALLEGFDDPRIRLHRNPARTGLVAQRNLSVELARAPLVAQLDADDVCAPERIETQVGFLECHPEVDVVGSQLRVIDGRGAVIGYRRYPLEHAAIVSALPRYNSVPNPAVMFRKRRFEQAGGYRLEGRAEDYELWCRLARSGARFAMLPEPLLDYRIHASSSKAATLHDELRDTLAVKRMHFGASMGVRARLRYLAERALLWLPPSLVLRLFMATAIRRRP